MKYAPHIMGAVALVAIAGAVSGATIGDSPVLLRDHPESMPEAPILTASNEALRTAKRPPDHYPLKTSDGTIAVADLALHGRLRDTRQASYWQEAGERSLMNAGYDFYQTASAERIEHERRLLAFHEAEAPDTPAAPPPAQPRRATRAEAPMALAEPVEVDAPAADGEAKSIDVDGALSESE